MRKQSCDSLKQKLQACSELHAILAYFLVIKVKNFVLVQNFLYERVSYLLKIILFSRQECMIQYLINVNVSRWSSARSW